MRNQGLLIGLGIFLAVAVGGFLFVRRPATTPKVEESATLSETTPAPEDSLEGEAREIVVTGDEYSFSPNSLSFTQGERVRLTFKNTGSQPHNLIIDELNVATKTIPRGVEDTLEFTAAVSGTFDFYCGVGNHRGLGMEGTLEVE